MASRTRYAQLAFAAALLSAAWPAQAKDLALEVVVGERSPDAGHTLRPFFDQLAKLGYDTEHTARAAIADGLSSEAVILGPVTSRKVREATQRARQAWISGEVDQAIQLFRLALRALDEKPASVALEPRLRDDRYDAMVGLAMALDRGTDKAQAQKLMSRVLRSYPDRELSRRKFGPDAHALYLRVRQGQKKAGEGTLRVINSSADAVLFINERYVSTGKAELKLTPGEYRVYSQRGQKRGRIHRVRVVKGEATELRIPWSLDRALRGEGLHFRDAKSRQRQERGFCKAIAGATGARAVITAGILQSEFVATRYEKGLAVATVRRKVAPHPPSAAELRDLARQLLSESAKPTEVVAEAQVSERSFGLASIITMSAGLAGVGTGAALLILDGNGSCDLAENQRVCPRNYDTQMAGLITLAAGSALVATSLALWLWPDGRQTESPGVTAGVSPGGAWLGYQGRF